MKLDTLPRIRLAQLPTPLEEAPRLTAALGGPRVFVKRDDLTGLGLGGNKARKLEFLMADAKERGADAVITAGGLQSNHCRITAAAAAKLGMAAYLVLTPPFKGEGTGSVLIDAILGATVVRLDSRERVDGQARMEALADELRAAGKTPYVVPVGGSNPVGAAGYVAMMRELADQCREQGIRPARLYHASGSAGTQGGIEVGARAFMPGTRITGIAVSRGADLMRQSVAELAQATADFLDLPQRFAPDEIDVDDRHYGAAYGDLTETGVEAIALAARTEGILLDPVYSGKAMAGLIAQAREGGLTADDTVVFLHTGGVPGLFAYSEGILAALAKTPAAV